MHNRYPMTTSAAFTTPFLAWTRRFQFDMKPEVALSLESLRADPNQVTAK